MDRRCAVLGDPIEHSLSPVLHRAGYAACGLDWRYDALRVCEGELPSFLDGLGPEWRGLSLTMPLKREALPLVDDVSDTARLAGAVNTLVFDPVDAGDPVESGASRPRVRGDNTDVPGAAAAIRERYQGSVTAGTVVGGGATATSAGLALCDLGASTVTLLVRSPERARESVEALQAHPAAPQVRVLPLDSPEVSGEVVVSTIPAHAQSPALVNAVRQVPVVFDVIYDPWPTPLAQALGTDQVLVSGLDLLSHQAVLQFAMFTGRQVDVDTLRAAGQLTLDQRG